LGVGVGGVRFPLTCFAFDCAMDRNPVDKSTAEAGEIADIPSEDDIFNAKLKDEEGRDSGFLIKWKTSLGAYIMASEDSHVSLDANM
jgi:hypothetical protein